MKGHKTGVLDQLLRMDLTEDVFEQILGILEHEQHRQMRKHRGIRIGPGAGVQRENPND